MSGLDDSQKGRFSTGIYYSNNDRYKFGLDSSQKEVFEPDYIVVINIYI